MESVKEFASKHNLTVIEDAAQAHGASYKGKKVGSIGDVGCFSFYPTKPLGALADAGMVTTNDEKIALKVRRLRNHGRAELNVHLMPGYTSRLDEIQAAVLLVKLKHLDEWNSQRRKIAKKYNELLDGLPLQTPYCLPSAEHVYYLYEIRVLRRDALRAKLHELGVETAIHYPTPIHLQPAYQHSYSRVPKLKQGEAAAKEILSLPMFAELSDEELEYICNGIRDFLRAS
jgi:dTDP-4-amino-4,6-dideoxygalactose transaminase